MDSLSLYLEYKKKYYLNSKPKDNLNAMSEIIKTVANELNNSPFELENSSFISEIKNIVQDIKKNQTKWTQRNLSIVDADIVVRGVKKMLYSSTYSVISDKDINSNSNFFFKEYNGKDGEDKIITDINFYLEILSRRLQYLKKSYQSNLSTPPKSTMVKSTVPNYAEKPKIDEWQKYILDINREHTKQLELRQSTAKEKIKAWQEDQAKITQSVKELQKPAQQLLEDFRNFSNTLMDNYILQFAKSQIELFNFITDNLNYHVSLAEKSQNREYYKAVENYKTYLEMIIDSLADFGVEEISSSQGTKFNGTIHNVKNTHDFSPQNAIIKKSLRIGFKYNTLVLQKEDVEV